MVDHSFSHRLRWNGNTDTSNISKPASINHAYGSKPWHLSPLKSLVNWIFTLQHVVISSVLTHRRSGIDIQVATWGIQHLHRLEQSGVIANDRNSLTRKKAILGIIPLTSVIPVMSLWGRRNLSITHSETILASIFIYRQKIAKRNIMEIWLHLRKAKSSLVPRRKLPKRYGWILCDVAL